jgi:hypothetical protein
MPRRFLVATFSDPDRLLEAVRAAREADFRVFDVYAPYPLHHLNDTMGVRHSRLPWVTLAAALGGLLTALALQFYTVVYDWPLNVGGKPDNSTLAFVPICFELTVLFGGLATVGALFLRARMFPGRSERLPAEGVTNNRFALVLRKRDSFDTERARVLLEKSGAEAIEEKVIDL